MDNVTVGNFGNKIKSSPKNAFRAELEKLLNYYSMENCSHTPDFILANFLIASLDNFDLSIKRREEWYGRSSK